MVKYNKEIIFRKSKDGTVTDTEFSFTLKGTKRNESFIMELGATSLKDENEKISYLINPFINLKNGRDMINQLIEMKQDPKKTIHFWIKVLLKKNLIEKEFIKKMRTTTQAEYLSKIIKKSIDYNNNFLKKNRISKYTDIIKKIENSSDKPKIRMYPAKLVLKKFKNFIQEHGNILYAHNGISADYKVIDGLAQKNNISFNNVTKCDTLHYFKKKYPQLKEICGYSQPKLYEHFFQEEYNAHVAIDDAIALRKLLIYSLNN